MLCALGRLFMVSSLSFGFSVVGFHSLPLMFFYLFLMHHLVYVCGVSLLRLWFLLFRVLWFFASMSALYVFFSLWGTSYLLLGGCASGYLDMRLFASLWLCSSDDYSFSGPLFLFFALVFDRDHLCSGDCFVSYFIFLPFSDICLF